MSDLGGEGSSLTTKGRFLNKKNEGPKILTVFAGSFTLLLGITNLISVVNRMIPLCIVRGLQLALGIQLVVTAHGMVR